MIVITPQATPSSVLRSSHQHSATSFGGVGRRRSLPFGTPSPVYLRRQLILLIVLVFAGVLVVPVAAASLRVHAAAATSPGSPMVLVDDPGATGRPPSGEYYMVKPDDTLWGIARSLRPDGDVRPLVDELAERAGGSSLVPGQRISLDGMP